MSWWFAAATFASGTISETEKKKGRYAGAKERDRSAFESLLTAKYNIRERNKESRQTQYQELETGGDNTRKIAIEGKRAEGAAAVAGGTSGAVVETGSTRAALRNIIQESISAQTDVVIDTKNRIKSIARQTKNANTSEWRNAKLNQRQQNRIAENERDAADREFTAGMINTGIKTYGAYKTAEGWNKVDTDSSVKVASDARSATGGKGNASLASSPYNQRGYAPTNWDRFKYNLKNRPFRPFTSNWSSALDWRSNKKTYK